MKSNVQKMHISKMMTQKMRVVCVKQKVPFYIVDVIISARY